MKTGPNRKSRFNKRPGSERFFSVWSVRGVPSAGMPPRVLEELKSFGKRLLDAYILTPLLAVLTPVALWTFARDFVTSPHTVPGWTMLVASALAAILLVSLGFHVVHWRRERRRGRRNLTVVAHGGLAAPRWQALPKGEAMALGVFEITNIKSADITIPKTILEISCPWFGVIARRRSFPGPVGIYDVLEAGSTLRNHQLRFDLPPGVVDGSFRGRVACVDNFGAHNWNSWETWERVEGWSCPGSVDGELLSRMLTAAPLRGIPR